MEKIKKGIDKINKVRYNIVTILILKRRELYEKQNGENFYDVDDGDCIGM